MNLRQIRRAKGLELRDHRDPLRVMFVITSMPVGGAETLLATMLDRFDSQRVECEVVCLKTRGPLGEEMAPRVTVHHGLLRNKWDIGVLPRLCNLFRDRKIDAVITVGAGDKMFWGRLAAWWTGTPVIASALHSTGWPDGVGRMNRWLTPLTDAFIAVADSHGQFMRSFERFPGNRVHVIRNGVDTDRFTPSPELASQVRDELGLPVTSKLVGIVAALRPEKNHQMFVQVASGVLGKQPDTHFLIIGDGPERKRIEQECDRLGVCSNVHLLGTRADAERLLGAMDLFLLCSHNEASPVSILEALACGVPVISTNVGSIQETVHEGKTGYLVDKGDVEQMVLRACDLLADDLRRQVLGSAGRQLVIETGSLDSMVEGYQSLVETLYDQAAQKTTVASHSVVGRSL